MQALDDSKVELLLTNGLPGATLSLLGEKKDDGTATYRISAPLKDNPSKTAFQGSISFKRDGSLSIGGLYLNQSAYDGMLAKQGIGKKFLSNLYELLQETDIHRINLATEKMGGYYWARAGFTIDASDTNQDINTYMIETGIKYLSIPEEEKNALKLLLQPPEDPKRFWRIAETKYGLELLKDVEYKAVLDFNDLDAKAAFKKYTTLSKDQERAIAETMAKVTGQAR